MNFILWMVILSSITLFGISTITPILYIEFRLKKKEKRDLEKASLANLARFDSELHLLREDWDLHQHRHLITCYQKAIKAIDTSIDSVEPGHPAYTWLRTAAISLSEALKSVERLHDVMLTHTLHNNGLAFALHTYFYALERHKIQFIATYAGKKVSLELQVARRVYLLTRELVRYLLMAASSRIEVLFAKNREELEITIYANGDPLLLLTFMSQINSPEQQQMTLFHSYLRILKASVETTFLGAVIGQQSEIIVKVPLNNSDYPIKG